VLVVANSLLTAREVKEVLEGMLVSHVHRGMFDES
jgi:hypothetical protein